MAQSTTDLIKNYFQAFNANDMETFLSLLDDNVLHDINQGGCQTGKEAFKKFMDHMNHCYEENITHLIIMTNEDGSNAAAKYMVEGTYLTTDNNFPDAKQQKYALPAGSFFTIKNNKITRVTTYYNVSEWINQVTRE
jgi:steroid delta-isomerase-like uncharacterized protein